MERCGELLTRGISENAVVINGGNGEGHRPGTQAWPGVIEYTERLKRLGCTVWAANPGPRTHEEALEFNALAEKMGYRRAIVIAQPFQLLRIMLAELKAMRVRQYPMRVYAVAPRMVDWRKTTNANQGKADLLRFEQIKDEFERVPYTGDNPEWKEFKKNHLATISELIEYMMWIRKVT